MIGKFLTFFALIAVLATSFAFNIAPKSPKVSALNAFAGGLPGAEGPELKTFDPLKFSEKSPEWVPWFRESELKHGRVAMLATLGYIVTDFVHLPGEVHEVSSLAAHDVAVKSGAMVQILFWTGLLEILTIPALLNLGKNDRAPGDYSFDPLKLGSKPKDLERYKVNELKNGRLAMLAFSGIITQAALTGKAFPYWGNFGNKAEPSSISGNPEGKSTVNSIIHTYCIT